MARLKNSETGVVVETSDENAAKLSGYEPVEAPKKAAAKAPAKSEK